MHQALLMEEKTRFESFGKRTPKLLALPEISPEIQWLISHYNPPRELTMDTGSLVEGDPMIEAAAKQYLVRKRKETFVEWLWWKFPPRPIEED